MDTLSGTYKQALLEARDRFDDRYRGPIADAVAEVVRDYDIAPDSELHRVISVAMRKFVLGLDQKLDIYTDWFNKHAAGSPNFVDGFKKTYPRYTKGMGKLVEKADFSPELEKLLRLDIGRSRVTSHAHQLIRERQDDIGLKPFGDASYDVLGSVVKQAIMIYYDEHGRDMAVGVERLFKSAIPRLTLIKDEMNADNNVQLLPA